MKKLKRLAAILMAFAMVALLIPGVALADQSEVTLETNTYTCEVGGSASTSLARYTTGITLTVKFSADVPVINGKASKNYIAYLTGDNFAETAVVPGAYTTVSAAVPSPAPQTVKGYGTFVFNDVKYYGAGNTVTVTVYDSPDHLVGKATLTIGECVVTADSSTATPTPTETTKPDPTAPGLIVKSSSIGTDAVDAGADFTLTLTVYATTSGTKNIDDVVVSVQPAEKGVVITSGSSTQYIGTMKPGTSQKVSFPMQAQSSFTEGVSNIAVTLTGSGAESFNTNIAVPVNQPDRFEISKVEVPTSLVVGEEDVATITFVNKGKNPVNNLTLALSCSNCAESSQNQYVGNLAAGTEDSVDFDLSPLDAGEMTGTITVTYEAPNGEIVTLTQDISCTAEAGFSYDDSMGNMGMDDMPVDGDVGAQPGLSPVVIALIVAGAVVVVIVIIVIVRKRKAKKKAQLEAEDEDL